MKLDASLCVLQVVVASVATAYQAKPLAALEEQDFDLLILDEVSSVGLVVMCRQCVRRGVRACTCACGCTVVHDTNDSWDVQVHDRRPPQCTVQSWSANSRRARYKHVHTWLGRCMLMYTSDLGALFMLPALLQAHHSLAPSWQKVVRRLGFMDGRPDKLVVGFTATPYRRNVKESKELQKLLPHMAYAKSVNSMIQDGWLVQVGGLQADDDYIAASMRSSKARCRAEHSEQQSQELEC